MNSCFLNYCMFYQFESISGALFVSSILLHRTTYVCTARKRMHDPIESLHVRCDKMMLI